MIKRVWLWLACLVLLLSFLGCKAELPTSPEVGFPVIDFYATPAQISVGECSVLSWSVYMPGFASNQTLRVFIRWGYIMSTEVERTGTLKMYPTVTTVYILVAVVGNKSATVSIKVDVEA